MKKILLTSVLTLTICAGCDWSAVESGAKKAESMGQKAGEVVAQVEQVFPAATGATTLVLGLTNIAAAVAAFAARRKAQKIAAAASAAADAVGKGGGTALVNAASVLGVASDIAKAYAGIKATNVSSK
jgi:uncharacterized membrane protein YjgN (DUF898 family)